MPHIYIGAVERTYPAYLEVPDDGDPRTLTGHPGGDPVEIRRGGGNEGSPGDDDYAGTPALPDVPGDGLWVPADPPAPNAPANSPPLAVVHNTGEQDPGQVAEPPEDKPRPRSRKAA